MDFRPFDRRQFLAGGGAAFVCTLAGHKLFLDKPADLPKLASGVRVPPDRGINAPNHQLGDTFRLTFNHPGIYRFQCKLHPGVRGTVDVSSMPGDPDNEIDPVPKINFDVTPPHLSEVKLRSHRFGRAGTTLHFGVDETSKIDAEYYEMRRGHRAGFAGWHVWHAHVGYNDVRFAGRSKHFRARPGSYMAVIRATDTSNNPARKRVRRFRIR